MPTLRHLLLPLSGALVCAVVVAGCTSTGDVPTDSAYASPPPPATSAPPSTAPSAEQTTSASSAPPRGSSAVTIQQAIAVARKAEKGTVVGAELDRFGESTAWRVDIRRSRAVTVEIAVNPATGAVLAATEDDTDDEAATVPGSTARAAADDAEGRVDGGQATQIELDQDGGRRVWQVSVRRTGDQPVEVTFDAESGRFVRQEVG